MAAHFDRSTIHSAHSDQLASCMAERRLWAVVITETAYRAMGVGEGTSIEFFRGRGGHFTTLCCLLGLPEDAIRQRVVSKALATLNHKQQKGAVNMEKNIWKDYIDNLHNNNGQPKQRFEALMKECNRLLVSMQGMEMTESNKSERLGLMGLSIQLQTSIAILNKLEAIEVKQD